MSRLAKFAAIPIVALVLAACTEQQNSNPTGDSAAPSLFGETANGFGFPHEVVTTEGIASAGLYLPIFLIATVIFLLIEGLLLFMVWRFRRKDEDTELPGQTHGNNRLEIIWTAIPALLVTVLFIGSTIVLTDVQAMEDDPDVVVDVQAFRFGWKFDYDNGVQIAGGGREGAPQMVLPVDQSIRFRLTAADVIHSFYVPSFFFKRDAIPGRTNEFELTIEKPGVYGGQCAEFCGLAHSDMFFSVRAVESTEYDAWVDEQTGVSSTPAADGTAAPSTGTVLEIATTADKPIAFTTSSLEAQAGSTVTIQYLNDSKVPHNVAVFDGPDATGSEIVATEVITGPGASAQATFTAPAEPGPYFFRCEIHPLQMTGTFTATP